MSTKVSLRCCNCKFRSAAFAPLAVSFIMCWCVLVFCNNFPSSSIASETCDTRSNSCASNACVRRRDLVMDRTSSAVDDGCFLRFVGVLNGLDIFLDLRLDTMSYELWTMRYSTMMHFEGFETGQTEGSNVDTCASAKGSSLQCPPSQFLHSTDHHGNAFTTSTVYSTNN